MSTADFLYELRTRDVRCWVEGDRLRLSAPQGALTPELQEEVVRRKPELLSYLRAVQAPEPPALPALRPQRHAGALPLSFAQERLWFLQRLDPESAAYNLQASLPLSGPLDRPALEWALAELVRRHETLRTSVGEVEGRPVQEIAPPGPVALPVADLRGLPPGDRLAEARRLATEEVRRPFDLARGPLVRWLRLALEDDAHELLVTQHHIVTDGWSIALLLEEALALYRAFAEGRPSPLPEPRVQYADFACAQREWLRGEVLERQLRYWRTQLAPPLSPLELPADRPRPAVQTGRGATLTFELPGPLSEGVKAFARAEGATPFMTLLTAFQALLSRYTGQVDVVVGTANGNRTWVETECTLGLFVNTLVLRTDLSGDPSFREALSRVRRVVLEAFAHGDMPFEKLVEELHPQRDLSRSPLFQVLFVIQNTPLQALVQGAARPSVLGEKAAAGYDLSLYLIDAGAGFRGTLEYSTDLFDEATMRRLARHYERLLAAAAAEAGQRLSALPLLADDERRELLQVWNATTRPLPEPCLPRLFEAQAAASPGKVAVSCGGRRLTYEELNRRANRLAYRLRRLGVRRGDLVALHLERSLEMMVALLGVHKAGGAYLPLDPSFPRERLAHMLADARPRVRLTTADLADALGPPELPVLRLDAEPLEDEPQENPSFVIDGEDLAYVLYTSGSTGRPKGVMVPHRALANLLLSMRDSLGANERDALLAVTTLSFDIAALELFLPLLTGGEVVLATREVASDGRRLAEAIAGSGATLMQATPATWRMLLESGWVGAPGLKVLCGGEALPADLPAALLPRCRELWNVYGPTETTVWSTAGRVESVAGVVPIGRPLANTKVYVLDAQGQPAPLGVPGELHIGGTGVAHGYLGRPDLTAERFVPSPFESGARLYRTGDRARFRADGTLECLGRLDRQAKIRGFRVEPGEVEASLAEHPAVRESAVVVREDAPGDRRLVAYVVGRRTTSVSELRAFLKERLPDYMVPAGFVWLPALPLTPNGKVDRRALPAPDGGRPELESGYAPPRGPVEEAVAEAWREVLGLERVGAHDDFFDLGGHSLKAAQVLARLHDTFGVELPLRSIFEAPTVAGLGEALEAARRAGGEPVPEVRAVLRDRPLPLSFSQERLWFLEQLDPGSAVYNIPGALRLRGPLDVGALEHSLGALQERHEALRTTFEAEDGEPRQRVAPPQPLSMKMLDLGGLPPEAREAEARRLAAEEARRPFDLAGAPLFRAVLLRLAGDDHVLLVTLHHLVADGWSLGVLVSELGALYRAFAAGEPSPLPEPAVQFADFACWQREWLRGERLERGMGYWRRQLAQAPVLALPTDRPRPPVQTFAGAQHHLWIPAEVTDGLRALGRRGRATLFMTLLAAFQELLHRYSGQEDVVVGTPIAGRHRGRLESLVGFFANTLVLRTDLSGDPSFRELLGRVREMALDAYAHQDVPFEKLVEELHPERNLAVSPLFQVLFVLQNAPLGTLDLGSVAANPFPMDPGTSRVDLTLFLTETAEGLLGTLEYNTDLFDPATAERLAGHYERLLRGVVRGPDRRLSELSLLSEAERRLILRDWNATTATVPAEGLIHRLVEAQARRTPEATAVEFEGARFSYRELDARAERLARRLRGLGVGPDALVGIALERGLDLPVALLGTLKAGGAYLPLDPAYPRDRLRFMLEDAGARVLVTHSGLRGTLPSAAAALVCLDEAWDDPGHPGREEDGPLPQPSPESLAYLIYTSGSTGRPKGVEVPHRAVVNFLASMREQPGLAAGDVLLAVTTLSFDIAALELFLPLVVGARTVLVSREVAADGRRLREALEASGANLMQATPATWRLLVESGWTGGERFKALCGGEALPGDLAGELLARCGSVWNLYGPTETTIWSALHAVRAPEAVAPLGRPIANTRIYVLDGRLEPVPMGVPGELLIGGAGVARGYHGRPDLTGERFVPDPFGGPGGERLYRTGDLARLRADGTIEFQGRLDQQVKVRGFRIEPGEIEATLRAHEGVAEAAVIARDRGAGDQQLVAYLVSRPGLEPTVTEMRAYLKERLPAHMVPSSFVSLDALPLTPNGKVDRKQLGRLEGRDRRGEGRPLPPRTPMEALIAGLWREALGLDRVSVQDNFFDLGGHSLLSLRVLARLEKAIGRRMNPREMIFQTLEQLAARCEGGAPPGASGA